MVGKRTGWFVWNTCHTGLHRAHPPVPQELCSYIFVHRTAEMLQIAAVSAQARANVLDEDVSRAFQAFPMHPVISSQKRHRLTTVHLRSSAHNTVP